jgi:hypothetical protein
MISGLNIKLKKSEITFGASLLFFLFFTFFSFEQNQIDLLLPLVAIISIGFLVLFNLIRREGAIEIYDAGALLIAITILYSFYPLFSFAMNNFETTIMSDNRLKVHGVTSSDMGYFAWNHVVYLISLSVSYLYFRPRKTVLFTNQNLKPVSSAEVAIGFLLMLFLSLYQVVIPALFGDTPPYIIKQLNNNFSALFFVMSIWFFAITLTRIDNNFFKIFLILYITFELIKVITGLSGRSWFVIHIIALALIYHRLIKPFSTKQLVVYIFLFLVVFLLAGFVKTSQASSISGVLGFFTGNEEFTAVFTTAYDLHIQKNVLQTVGEIPFAVSTFDFNNIIPSQFLPFEKMSQAQWYLYINGWENDGVGFAFGAISQGILGWGKLDLLIRGLVTGTFFGFLHRTVNNKNVSIWSLVFYVFIAIKGYQTFRAGTGYILYFVVYQFLPCYLLIKFLLISSSKRAVNLSKYKYLD